MGKKKTEKRRKTNTEKHTKKTKQIAKNTKKEKKSRKRGFRITKSVLEVIMAVKKYGEERVRPQDIYAAIGRKPVRKVNGKLVETKAFKRWKEILAKLERAGYVIKKKNGYRVTPAAGRLLSSRIARLQSVKGIRARRVKKKRGRTEKPAKTQKAWGIMIVDERMDKRFMALPPGKRISRSGKVYYEYRPNRSDINPKRGL